MAASDAYVRLAKSAEGQVPKWQGGRMPLSTELAHAVERLLHERPDTPELRAVASLLDLQARLTPLAFPLWAESLRRGEISTEDWRTRVQRAAERLERRHGR